MIFDFFIWILCFLFFNLVILLLNYWTFLFSSQEKFSKGELIGIPSILRQEIKRLLGGEYSWIRCLNFFFGVLTSWILTLLGGLFSPDSGNIPDHASAEVPNYFFQSILFLLILHLMKPSLKEIEFNENRHSFLYHFLSCELLFFLGLSIALPSITIVLWGIYHKMNFLFCLINLILCLSYAFYRLRREESISSSSTN